MKSIIITLSVLFFMNQLCLAQNEILKKDTLQYKNVFAAKNFTFYGIDYSPLEYVEADKVGTEAEIATYFAPWISSFENSWYDLNEISSTFQKTTYLNREKVQRSFQSKKGSWVTFERHPLTLDSIRKIVKTYETKGDAGTVGFVVLVEAFEKSVERAFIDVVFFDNASKEVLWRVKIAGDARKGGMTNHWSGAVDNAFHEFLLHYKQELKKYKNT
jgi:hypothetical protein